MGFYGFKNGFIGINIWIYLGKIHHELTTSEPWKS